MANKKLKKLYRIIDCESSNKTIKGKKLEKLLSKYYFTSEKLQARFPNFLGLVYDMSNELYDSEKEYHIEAVTVIGKGHLCIEREKKKIFIEDVKKYEDFGDFSFSEGVVYYRLREIILNPENTAKASFRLEYYNHYVAQKELETIIKKRKNK